MWRFAPMAALCACAAPGTRDSYDLPSELVGRTFAITTFVAEGVDPDGPLDLVVALDGDTWTGQTARIVAELSDEGVLPPTLLVTVGYGDGPNERATDYLPDSPYEEIGGGVDVFHAFLAQELLPWVAERWEVPEGPAGRVLVGHSFGGVAVVWGMLHGAPFEGIVALSPSLYFGRTELFDHEAAYATAHDDLDARLHLAAGSLEAHGMAALTDAFGATLAAREWPSLALQSEILAGRDHTGTYEPGVRAGLVHALEGR